MSEQTRKKIKFCTRARAQEAWRDEIAGDVFELWIGISRLMARVQAPAPVRARTIAAKTAPYKRTRAAGRASRRKAA